MTDTSTADALATLDLRSLHPATKVRIVEAMGFSPMGADHTYDCPLTIGGNGYLCNCVGEPTSWNAPDDVAEMRGETYAQLLAKRTAQRTA